MELKRTDVKLLREALASNGGGVNADFYSEAARKRMLKAGLIQWKPNSKTFWVQLLTITQEGKKALKDADQ